MFNKNILIITDFLEQEVSGGAEANDTILCDQLQCDIVKCHEFNQAFENTSYDLHVVSNFYFLSEEAKNFLQGKKYVIIEHDYKFLITRNPANYPNFQAPPEQIINREFYQNAQLVILQSKLQKHIFDKNIPLKNIHVLSANLWTDDDLFNIEFFGKASRHWNGTVAILQSNNPIKGTTQAIEYAKSIRIRYNLIGGMDKISFREELGEHSALLFLPQSPETLSRLVVEARMMDLVVLTNDFCGALHEDFYLMKGREIVEYMRDARNKLCDLLKSI